MVVWMGGMLLAFRGVWPLIQRAEVTADLVISLLWLTTGATAWIVALNFGLQRFRRR
jgi:hypothetical protein